MTGLLASVNNLQEARIVLDVGVDIIDLKQPAQGALGALEIDQVKTIVVNLSGKKPISATIGDLPMQAEPVYAAAKAMVDTGVDYIKIGLFPDGDSLDCIDKLSTLTNQGIAIIAVFFADSTPDLSLIPILAEAKFKGVMLDTMDKNKGSLTSVMDHTTLAQFVQSAKQHGLLCGLAGSLQINDIKQLIELDADYLGFRGALCPGLNRTAELDKDAVLNVKSTIIKFQKELGISSVITK